MFVPPRLTRADATGADPSGPDAQPLLSGPLAGRSGLVVRWDSETAQRQHRRRRVAGLGWTEVRDAAGTLRALEAQAEDAALALLSEGELKAVARRLGAREMLVLVPRASAVRVLDAWAAGRDGAVEEMLRWGRELPGEPLGERPLLVRDGVCVGILDDTSLLRVDGSREPFGEIAPAYDRMDRSAAVLAAQVMLFGVGLATMLLVLMSLW